MNTYDMTDEQLEAMCRLRKACDAWWGGMERDDAREVAQVLEAAQALVHMFPARRGTSHTKAMLNLMDK